MLCVLLIATDQQQHAGKKSDRNGLILIKRAFNLDTKNILFLTLTIFVNSLTKNLLL